MIDNGNEHGTAWGCEWTHFHNHMSQMAFSCQLPQLCFVISPSLIGVSLSLALSHSLALFAFSLCAASSRWSQWCSWQAMTGGNSYRCGVWRPWPNWKLQMGFKLIIFYVRWPLAAADKKRGMGEQKKKEEAVLALIQFSAPYPLVGFHTQSDEGRDGSENDRVSKEQPLLLQIKIFSSYLPGVDLPVPSVRFLYCVISFNICSGGRVSRPPVINTHRRNVGLNGFLLGADSGSLCTNIHLRMLPLIWHPYGMWRDALV